jgi:hypothetical protein
MIENFISTTTTTEMIMRFMFLIGILLNLFVRNGGSN